MIHRLAVLLCCLWLASCSDDTGTGIPTTNTPTLPTGLVNSFRVQGGIYTNATFRGFTADSAAVAYNDDAGAIIGFSGLTPTNVVFSVAIDVPQRRTGTFTIAESEPTRFSMQIGSTSYVAVDGVVEITTFLPDVGQIVAGAFSATMTPFPGPGSPISVAAGQFSIKRTASP
jgi:hypothetical protein